jgi:hypothetical protein
MLHPEALGSDRDHRSTGTSCSYAFDLVGLGPVPATGMTPWERAERLDVREFVKRFAQHRTRGGCGRAEPARMDGRAWGHLVVTAPGLSGPTETSGAPALRSDALGPPKRRAHQALHELWCRSGETI